MPKIPQVDNCGDRIQQSPYRDLVILSPSQCGGTHCTFSEHISPQILNARSNRWKIPLASCGSISSSTKRLAHKAVGFIVAYAGELLEDKELDKTQVTKEIKVRGQENS